MTMNDQFRNVCESVPVSIGRRRRFGANMLHRLQGTKNTKRRHERKKKDLACSFPSLSSIHCWRECAILFELSKYTLTVFDYASEQIQWLVSTFPPITNVATIFFVRSRTKNIIHIQLFRAEKRVSFSIGTNFFLSPHLLKMGWKK